VDANDLEELAVATYTRHGFDSSEPASPAALATSILKTDKPFEFVRWIVAGNGARHAHGALFRFDGQRRIAVARGSSPALKPHPTRLRNAYQLFAICHELAHIILEEAAYAGDRLEDSCDYLGACLIAPRPAMRKLHESFGMKLGPIADATASTQTWAVLRLGEVLGVPLAQVQPTKVRYRGAPDQLSLFPDEATLRAWASAQPRPGLVRVKIADARGRAAIIRVA
jgi:hypothetical protein